MGITSDKRTKCKMEPRTALKLANREYPRAARHGYASRIDATDTIISNENNFSRIDVASKPLPKISRVIGSLKKMATMLTMSTPTNAP